MDLPIHFLLKTSVTDPYDLARPFRLAKHTNQTCQVE
jgi:hypothetical protein